MLWNTPQSGYNTTYPGLNCVVLFPGDDYALLDGTEGIAATATSVHFARGSQGSDDAGTTFAITGCPNNSVIEIQASNGVSQSQNGEIATTVTPTPALMDASFQTVQTITGNGLYTDVGRAMFYRVLVLTFQAGDVPVVLIKR